MLMVGFLCWQDQPFKRRYVANPQAPRGNAVAQRAFSKEQGSQGLLTMTHGEAEVEPADKFRVRFRADDTNRTSRDEGC